MAAECNIQHTLKGQHPILNCLQHKLAAAESASDNAFHAQALAHYQSALRDIYTVLPFEILMQCTRARQAVGDLGSAICDVLKAIEHYPADPRGYLLAANLYLEQDMLRDALLTCDKGCANADDDMPAYKDLQSMRCKLLQDVYVCNSSISERLSSEIIDQILSLLPIKSQVQLAMTCKHWNTYVFNFWPGIWNTVQLTCLSNQKEHLLSTIPGQHVRHLIIDAGIPWKARERLIANQWDQLESLVYAEGDMAPWNWFQQLIKMNTTTLKRVELYESETVQYSKGWMYLVLSACPNLETFHCVGYNDSTNGSVLIPTSSALLVDHQFPASLTLPLARISATSPSIARCIPEILPHCPYLEEISFDDYKITSGDDINEERLLCQILTAIDQHCPIIKKVDINPRSSSSIRKNGHPTIISAAKSGVQSLSFHLFNEHNIDNKCDQALTSFIKQHHTTLVKLSISMVHNGWNAYFSNGSSRPMQYLERLSELDIPKMRDLTISQHCHISRTIFYYDINRVVHHIIQRCHSLEYLQLINCFDAKVLQSVADHLDRQRLRTIRLAKHAWDQCEQHESSEKQYRDMAIDSLCRTFNHTMILTIIDLDIGAWVDDRVLRAIGHNDKHRHALTRLRIGKDNEITSKGVLDFANDMQQSQLTHLSIHLCYDNAIDDILELSTLPYLVNIEIVANCDYPVARNSLCRFFTTTPNTTRLRISYAYHDGSSRKEPHQVYTCSGMDGSTYLIDLKHGAHKTRIHFMNED